ncbi:hypothetical protein ACPC54_05055 [Kitasatospora sp. NPDC094028]
MRAELPSWYLWQPQGADPAKALLEILTRGALPPETIIWLNEAQRYLLGNEELATQIADGLLDLLTEADTGPVLIVGTMWPRFWKAVTDDSEGEHGSHARVKVLMELAQDVRVPNAFSRSELMDVASVLRSDPRLIAAERHAPDGRITQYLAGVPLLLRRYRQADPPARAVLYAALDARRLGHQRLFSAEFLSCAAEGYLSAADWSTTEEHWFEAALIDLTKPQRGLPGPLEQYRPRPGDASQADSGYQLADAIQDHDRQVRPVIEPPMSLWTAAARHSPSRVVLRALSNSARTRGVARAEELFIAAARWGYGEDLHWLVRHHYEAGLVDRAERLALAGLEQCYASALRWAGFEMADAGLLDRAEAAGRQLAKFGDASLLRALAYRAARAGSGKNAIRLYEAAVACADVISMGALLVCYERQGRFEAAERLAREWVRMGVLTPLFELGTFREQNGRVHSAMALYEALDKQDRRDWLAMRADCRFREGDIAGAESLYEVAAKAGSGYAAQRLSEIAGRIR